MLVDPETPASPWLSERVARRSLGRVLVRSGSVSAWTRSHPHEPSSAGSVVRSLEGMDDYP